MAGDTPNPYSSLVENTPPREVQDLWLWQLAGAAPVIRPAGSESREGEVASSSPPAPPALLTARRLLRASLEGPPLN